MRHYRIKFTLQYDLEKVVEPAANKMAIIDDHDIPNCDPDHFSLCDSHRIGFFVHTLCSDGLWPMVRAFRKYSITSMCENLTTCDFKEYTELSTYKLRCSKCCYDLPHAVELATEKAENAFAGLCLDCVKHHKKNKEEWAKCRVPHNDFRGLEQDRDKTDVVEESGEESS